MPRASRYLLPGYTYHLTHRCQDREFRFRFAKDRNAYREWLRIAVRRYGVSVYGYCVTSSHVHLVVHIDQTVAVGRMMQLASGTMAREYNRRKGHSGAFWEDQYHCTVVENGRYLWNCLRYVDLNMVRAGRVGHPRDWEWCGYHELMGTRERYRLVATERLLESLGGVDEASFRASYERGIEDAIRGGDRTRQPAWSECLAVGSELFVDGIQRQYTQRREFAVSPVSVSPGQEVWTLRESSAAYSAVSAAKSDPNPEYQG